MGESVQMVAEDGATTMLPRYGVWRFAFGDRKPSVCEVSDDLQKLLDTYALTTADVKLLRARPGEADEGSGAQ